MDQATRRLDGIDLFEGLSAEDLDDIARQCAWRQVPAEQQVFDKNSDTQDVYFVVGGAVRILTPGLGEAEVALADIRAGTYFGELAAIDGMRRSARVVALIDAELASLPAPDFLELMRRHPEIALRVLSRLTRVIRNLDSRVTDLSTKTDSQRIFAQLAQLALPDPASPETRLIPDLPNHREIASWTGTSKEAVAQAIGDLARDGIVRRKGVGLQIPQWDALIRLVG